MRISNIITEINRSSSIFRKDSNLSLNYYYYSSRKFQSKINGRGEPRRTHLPSNNHHDPHQMTHERLFYKSYSIGSSKDFKASTTNPRVGGSRRRKLNDRFLKKVYLLNDYSPFSENRFRKVDGEGKDGNGSSGGGESSWSNGVAAQAIVGSISGVLILGFGGYAYHTWYKWSVLKKMAIAFEAGYDPVLVLDSASKRASNRPEHARPTYKRVDQNETRGENSEGEDDEVDDEVLDEVNWIARHEQELIDQIVHGTLAGQYWLITGPKGTGKFSLIADAMNRNQAEGVAVCECSDNLEIFRLRLGKCLNFEYAEDYIGGLFSRRDPREGGPLVDIERALNKLEKVAIDYHLKKNRPLILVFNNIHHLRQDEDSYSLLLQLQQRAEAWSQAGIVTIVFSSDDHWPYTTLRKKASRMSVLRVKDLKKEEAIRAIRAERRNLWKENRSADDQEINEVWNLVGGRIGYLSWCMKHKDMIHAARAILEREKQWLLSRIGLIVDCDDDVMDEQKWSSSSLLLMQALVDQAEEESESNPNSTRTSHFPQGVPYWQARQIMTRTDFLSQLDHENMISIDIDFFVRPDSILMLNVIREICKEEGFKDRLESVLERIGDIESLGRTRELIWKSGKDGEGVLNVKLER